MFTSDRYSDHVKASKAAILSECAFWTCYDGIVQNMEGLIQKMCAKQSYTQSL